MKGILGKKIGMTQIFDKNGAVVPVTVIEAKPSVITAIRTMEKDTYTAICLGQGDVKKNKVIKPVMGQYLKNKLSPKKVIRELRLDDISQYKIGQELTVNTFKVGEYVDVVGTTIGKGFAGVIKRWKFSGGGETHGSMHHRKGASSGDTNAARHFPGKKKPGRMGNKRKTMVGLEVIMVDENKNIILVKGAIPGAKNSLVMVKKSTRDKSKKVNVSQ